ncbi:MAG: type II toxin-antitoxin system VapC family toxin [Acidimicrobiia bacterium]
MSSRAVAERVIIDASAMVDLLVGSTLAISIRNRLRGHELYVPAHFDAEVLSALGRLHRGGYLRARQVTKRIDRLAAAPIERHALPPLLTGAWRRRHNLRLVDALYVELANRLEVPIVTTDAGLAAASPIAEHLAS